MSDLQVLGGSPVDPPEMVAGERILLMEDDLELGAQVVGHLEKAGFAADWWREGRSLEPSRANELGLVILDLMLPGKYGLEILKELRAFAETPVLVLSARNDTADKIRAFRLGADDYITKPFWPEELLERVRARLRRPILRKDRLLDFGVLHLDLEQRTVSVEGRDVEVTRVELDLLAALMKRPGAAVTRRWLAENVLDPEREGTERTIDVHVSRLRKKLGREELIETVWGIGYRLKIEKPRET